MSSEIAIKIENLSKCYHIYEQPLERLKQFILPKLQRIIGKQPKQYFREFWALKDASFEIKKGEIVGIIGRNGSGKSTLLKMICGVLSQTQGGIQIQGKVAALLELGSGFNPEFTGRENVYLNGSVLGLSREEIDSRFNEIASFAELGDFIDQPVKTYSSGMLVRLAFSVITHVDADVLIVDEALAVGDVFFSSKCIDFIKDFSRHGTVLFVSHDVNTVINLCDKSMLINGGIIKAQGSPKEIVDFYHQQCINDHVVSIAQKNITTIDCSILDFEEVNTLSGFRINAASSGNGLAKIVAACLISEGEIVRTVLANSDVELHIWIEISEAVKNPIAGFSVKNKQGQLMFELNTSSLNSQCENIDRYTAHANIKFKVPFLKTSQYLVDVAIANGTLTKHVQLQWVYDCFAFNVLNENKNNGLISISVSGLSFEVVG